MATERDNFNRATLEWPDGGDLTIVDDQLATESTFGIGQSPLNSPADFLMAITVPDKTSGGFGFNLDAGSGLVIVLEIDSSGAGTWRILGLDGGDTVFSESGSRVGGSIGTGERVRFSRSGDTLIGSLANTASPDLESEFDWDPVVVATATDIYLPVNIGVFINQTSTRLDSLEALVAPPVDYSVRLSGGASNSDPAASIGGEESSTPAGSDLFDDLTANERDLGIAEYRVIYIANDDDIAASFAVTVSDDGNAAAQIKLAVAAEAAGETVPALDDAYTVPDGVSFGTTADLGSLDGGEFRGLYVERTSPSAQLGGLTLTASIDVTIS